MRGRHLVGHQFDVSVSLDSLLTREQCRLKAGAVPSAKNIFVISDTKRYEQSPGILFTGHQRIQYDESPALTADSAAVLVQCWKQSAGSRAVLDRDRLQNVKWQDRSRKEVLENS